jgi:hypothetical protein
MRKKKNEKERGSPSSIDYRDFKDNSLRKHQLFFLTQW